MEEVVLIAEFFFTAIFTVIPVINKISTIIAEAIAVDMFIFPGIIVESPFTHVIPL